MPNEPAPDAAPLRLIITAGYDRAPQAIGLLQLLLRDGHQVAAVLVVSPFQAKRATQLLRRGGFGALRAAARKLLSRQPKGDSGTRSDPIGDFFKANELADRSLKALAAEHGITYRRVSDLNAPEAIEAVKAARADGLLFCGGGMLRSPLLEACDHRILNAHAGPLPAIRGMNAIEWSLLTGQPTEVTIHYIDKGVDTGPVLAAIPVEAAPGDDIEALRARGIVSGIVGLRGQVAKLRRERPERRADAASSPQYFTLSAPLKALLAERLERERSQG